MKKTENYIKIKRSLQTVRESKTEHYYIHPKTENLSRTGKGGRRSNLDI